MATKFKNITNTKIDTSMGTVLEDLDWNTPSILNDISTARSGGNDIKIWGANYNTFGYLNDNANAKISTVILQHADINPNTYQDGWGNTYKTSEGSTNKVTIMKTDGSMISDTITLSTSYSNHAGTDSLFINDANTSFKVLAKMGGTTYFTTTPDVNVKTAVIKSTDLDIVKITDKAHTIIAAQGITKIAGELQNNWVFNDLGYTSEGAKVSLDPDNQLATIKYSTSTSDTLKTSADITGFKVAIDSYLPMNQVDTIQDKLKVMGINDYTAPTVNKVFAAIVGTYNIELFGDGTYNFETIS